MAEGSPGVSVLGPKALGTGGGAIVATALAGDATTVSMKYLGFAVDPSKFEEACNNLVHGFWFGALGAVGLIGGMVAAYYYRRAERRWGSGGKTPPV